MIKTLKSEKSPKILFLSQVPHDSVLISEERGYSVHKALEDILQVAEAAKEWRVLIRLHPGGGITNYRSDYIADAYRGQSVPENVMMFAGDEISTYELMEVSDVAITISSQSGLEWLWTKKPLILLGHAFYGHLKGVMHASSFVELHSLIKDALAKTSLTSEESAEVDEYLYSLIFKHLIPYNRRRGVFNRKGKTLVRKALVGQA